MTEVVFSNGNEILKYAFVSDLVFIGMTCGHLEKSSTMVRKYFSAAKPGTEKGPHTSARSSCNGAFDRGDEACFART